MHAYLHVRVCMCIHVCICMHPYIQPCVRVCLCVRAHVYPHVHMRVPVCIPVRPSVCVHASPCMCASVRTHVCVRVCLHARVCVYGHVRCMHVCVYPCVCTRVHTHARVCSAGGSLVRFIDVLVFLRHYRVLDDITQILKQHVLAGPARRYAAPGSPLPRPKPRQSWGRAGPHRGGRRQLWGSPSRPGLECAGRGGNADTRPWTRSLDEVIPAGMLRGN